MKGKSNGGVMMKEKRILTVQDISCVGQCSLTVALPILSACGLETCVLPSAVLSTHTAGFHGYTFRDLTADMPAIRVHWQQEGIDFDGFYTGYLGSAEQIQYIEEIFAQLAAPGALKVVDPAMADNGALYPAFDLDYVAAMRGLCCQADYIVPNITEACLLADIPYLQTYDAAAIDALLRRLEQLGCKRIVLTGVSYAPERTGVVVAAAGRRDYYEHPLLPQSCHGTGDIYASAFCGALFNGKSDLAAARIAADYTLDCIRETATDPAHWYGARFERLLPRLAAAVMA